MYSYQPTSLDQQEQVFPQGAASIATPLLQSSPDAHHNCTAAIKGVPVASDVVITKALNSAGDPCSASALNRIKPCIK